MSELIRLFEGKGYFWQFIWDEISQLKVSFSGPFSRAISVLGTHKWDNLDKRNQVFSLFPIFPYFPSFHLLSFWSKLQKGMQKLSSYHRVQHTEFRREGREEGMRIEEREGQMKNFYLIREILSMMAHRHNFEASCQELQNEIRLLYEN